MKPRLRSLLWGFMALTLLLAGTTLVCAYDISFSDVPESSSPRELVARVKAVLARTMPKPAEATGSYTFGDLSIDTASHSVKVAGQEASLTPKEFDLLVFLVSNKGIALSREKILQKVWNYDYYGEDRTVDTHVKMLRGHLGACRKMIVTVWGIGYKFDPDAV